MCSCAVPAALTTAARRPRSSAQRCRRRNASLLRRHRHRREFLVIRFHKKKTPAPLVCFAHSQLHHGGSARRVLSLPTASAFEFSFRLAVTLPPCLRRKLNPDNSDQLSTSSTSIRIAPAPRSRAHAASTRVHSRARPARQSSDLQKNLARADELQLLLASVSKTICRQRY